MKFLLPHNEWQGGFVKSIIDAIEFLGHNVSQTPKYKPSFYSRVLHRLDNRGYFGVKQSIKNQRQIAYNQLLIDKCKSFKPDVFFNFSGGGYLPDTIKEIQKGLGIKTVCYIADNPVDPARDKYLAMTLQYYDVLLFADKIWLKILDKLAPDSLKIKFLGGYDPKKFYPASEKDTDTSGIKQYLHDIVFTGGSYINESPEGTYRAGVLGQLASDGYDVHIWGDEAWSYRQKFYPALNGKVTYSRLPYDELRKLMKFTGIYLNMPSPQILTSFQPRVFEIAASKGFQIIDYSDELKDIFGDEYVSFQSYKELKQKINYYLKHPEERAKIVDLMYLKVRDEYTWTKQIERVISQI